MIRAIAIDDEPLALQVLQNHAARVDFFVLEKTFTNAKEGRAYFESHKPHALFLDIRMPDHDGMDMAISLPKSIQVIFTTAYSEYAARGFELDATDYLLKPISFDRFLQACNKIKHRQEATGSHEIVIRENGFWHKVQLPDILYVEAKGNYLNIVCKSRSYLIRQTMHEIDSQLPTCFCRMHKSYIINTKYAIIVSSSEVSICGRNIPIGANYKSELLTKMGVR